ncbi:DUF302 domain-containing protein [Bacteroidetes/Chlorobi group bacterium Naka2016]|jgi:uncharacterized protein (DUF302 family)|nr:MAG: DUF302 domain-containing protein [Bacteroidetes/Chlorobi group bacterium Naka2016]
MSYFFAKTLNVSFDEAIEKVTNALKEKGFGIVSEIFVSEVLKEKVGVEIQPYKILGACNPHFALKAISTEPHIGLMLPCNIVVRQIDSNLVEVSGIDPIASMMAIKNPKLQDLATEVQMHIKNVIESL